MSPASTSDIAEKPTEATYQSIVEHAIEGIFQTTPDGRYLLGRWVEPGNHMLLLLRSIDVDGAPGATCDVNAVVEPDVYVRSGSNVKAVSQELYRTQYAAADNPAAR